MIKVLELKGQKSLRALNALQMLIIGMRMQPAWLKSNIDFWQMLIDTDEANRRKALIEACRTIELDPAEVEACLSFCADPNGIPYSKVNMGNLNPFEIADRIAEVCMSILAIEVSLINDAEKKSSKSSQ